MKTRLDPSAGRRADSLKTRPPALNHVAGLVLLLSPLFLKIVQADPNVVAWGSNQYGQSNVPLDLTNAVMVAGGGAHSLALRSDGTVVAWGAGFVDSHNWPDCGQCMVPPGLMNVVAVAAGYTHSLALKSDGTVVAWGRFYAHAGDNPVWVPNGLTNVVAIKAGMGHSLALKADGTVVAWSESIPSGLSNVTAVAAGDHYSAAVRADGSVVAWGSFWDGHSPGPGPVPEAPTNVLDIAAGDYHGVALRPDGSVVQWPKSADAGIHIPAGLRDVTAVAAGHAHALASRSDGSVAAWGYYWDNGVTYPLGVPQGLSSVLAVASGESHCLALVGAGAPVLTARIADRQTFKGGTVYWECVASGQWPLSYQWQFDGRNLPGATNRVLVLTNVDSINAGAYSVIVSNALGSTLGPPALLTLVPALLNTQPQDQSTHLGGFATFSVEAQAAGPLTYQWRFNGTPLAGATNSSLALSHLPLHQAGTYSVEVSSDAGIVTSREARLDVGVVRIWGGGRWASHPRYSSGLTNVLAVAADFMVCMALKDDRTVVAWVGIGADSSTAPVFTGLTNLIGISAGGGWGSFLALKEDGGVIGWPSLETIAGPTNIVAVARPQYALRADGTVLEIGPDGSLVVVTGLSNVVAVAGGDAHGLALRADGNVVAWGTYWNGTNYVPVTVPAHLTNVVAIACGGHHSLALTADGQVVDWGYFHVGAGVLPAVAPLGLTNVVAVAGGAAHGLALRADGTVVAWGQYYNDDDTHVPATVPDDLWVVSSLTSAGQHWLAITGNGPPVVTASLNNPTRSADGFSVSVATQSGRVYALEYKHTLADAVWTALPLVAGTGHERTLIDPTVTGAQRFYRVRRW